MQQIPAIRDIPVKRAAGLTRRSQDRLVIALFLLPALVLFLLFVIYQWR